MALYDSQSSSNALQFDPALLARYGQNYDRALGIANTPFQPYPYDRVAPNTPYMTAGQDSIWNWASDPTAANTIEGATNATRDMLGYRAPTIAAPTAMTARSISSADMTPSYLRDMDLSKYQNPFTDQVINTTLDDLERSRQVQRKNDQQSATLSNSFGGSRHGVADSLTNGQFARTAASTSAGLRSDGYDKAIAAATGDVNRTNDASVFNIGNRLNVDRYNAGAGDAADQFNINNRMTIDRENANNDITGAGLRLRGAGLLADLGGKQDEMGRTRASAVYNVGKDDQARSQSAYDANYEEFMRMIGYPAQTQDILNSTLNGMPRNTTSTSSSNVNPGIGSQIQSWGSLIGGAAGLADRFGLFDGAGSALSAGSGGDWGSYIDSLGIGNPSNFDWNASWFDAPSLW